MRRLTKRITLMLAMALMFSLATPQSSQAGVIPWAYSAIFGPPGSLAQWRAQAMQNRAMRISMRQARRPYGLFGLRRTNGYSGFPAYGGQACCGYGQNTYGYTPTYYGGGCSTGGCYTNGCSTTTSNYYSTYYAPLSYGYACNNSCNSCGVTTSNGSACGTAGCATGGCTPVSYSNSKITPIPETENYTTPEKTFAPEENLTPAESATKKGINDDGFRKPTGNVNENNSGGEATPYKSPIPTPYESRKLDLKKNLDGKGETETPEKEKAKSNEEAWSFPSKTDPNLVPEKIELRVAWNSTVRRTRVGRRAQFSQPTVARSDFRQLSPFEMIDQAEIQVASSK